MGIWGCAVDETEPGSNVRNENVAICGNGSLENGEQCDDGDAQPADGCSATCMNEPPCHKVLSTDPAALKGQVDKAIETAVASLRVSGLDFDWENVAHRDALFERVAVELGCYIDRSEWPVGPAARR